MAELFTGTGSINSGAAVGTEMEIKSSELNQGSNRIEGKFMWTPDSRDSYAKER